MQKNNRTYFSIILIFILGFALSAVMADPEKAKEHFNSGLTAEQDGNPEEAALAYQAAIAEDPDFIDAYINLGAIYFKQKDYQKALKMYRSAVEKDGKNATAFSNLGNVEYKLKKICRSRNKF
ncbi:MAG: tetratricopeptide repeat protein [candidate division Zixibacteria bacterium]